MRDRRCQLDVTHTVAAHLGECDFNAALLADDALVLHALVFTAKAFVILHGAKDARAEQAVFFRLERAVVDGFRLFDFTVRPGQDLLRACDGNADLVEALRAADLTEKIHDFIHVYSPILYQWLSCCFASGQRSDPRNAVP